VNVFLYGGPRHGDRLALMANEETYLAPVLIPHRELTEVAQSFPTLIAAEYRRSIQLRDGSHLFEFIGWR
jgi:hypothetical protein